ncbi:MAG: hypothetical protein KW788_02185 [Candidatus Doudnabacteria bacterium]|nr:hypothetical protein [Candidatus Doudnabacteria bacterium]
MKLLFGLIIGFIGGVIVVLIFRSRARKMAERKLAPNQKQTEIFETHLQSIIEYMRTHLEIDNARVEAMLQVSPSTAERYLDTLERRGLLVQMGKTGQSVVYRNA